MVYYYIILLVSTTWQIKRYIINIIAKSSHYAELKLWFITIYIYIILFKFGVLLSNHLTKVPAN